MKFKKIFLLTSGFSFCILLMFGWIKYNEGGPAPYPINTGSFYKIGSAFIDPELLLEDVRNGRDPLLTNIQADFPEDLTFVMAIGWSQKDYLDIAEVLHEMIWNESLMGWHLYRVSFYSACENPNGGFSHADLYYYQEVEIDGKRKYSVHNILIQPEFGYIAWGGDSIYPRPIFGWEPIENIVGFPAEEVLELADQQSGNEFRANQKNECGITVGMWPWGYDRNDWKVSYSSNITQAGIEIWVP